MINALDKKINALAARHGWHISPRTGDGLHWYEIAPMDRPDRDAIRAAGASPATLQGVGAHGSTRSTITTNTIGGYTL